MLNMKTDPGIQLVFPWFEGPVPLCPVQINLPGDPDHWEKRVLPGGFVQHREIYPSGRKGPWEFHVIGFGIDDCSVLAEPHPRQVPIDDEGRITINGKKYGRGKWNH